MLSVDPYIAVPCIDESNMHLLVYDKYMYVANESLEMELRIFQTFFYTNTENFGNNKTYYSNHYMMKSCVFCNGKQII